MSVVVALQDLGAAIQLGCCEFGIPNVPNKIVHEIFTFLYKTALPSIDERRPSYMESQPRLQKKGDLEISISAANIDSAAAKKESNSKHPQWIAIHHTISESGSYFLDRPKSMGTSSTITPWRSATD